MRKIAALIIVIFYSEAFANTDILGKNLLKNAAFENELNGWRMQLGGSWSANQGQNDSGTLIMRAEIPPDDQYIYETTVDQCVILPVAEKFQLKAKFKAEAVQTGDLAEKASIANRVNVIWYETLDCSSGGQFGGWIEPKNTLGWQHLLQRHLTPAFGAKAAKIAVVQNGRYARGQKAYWDDISFYASEVSNQKQFSMPSDPKHTLALYENYVKNSDFDKDLSSWHTYRTTWSNEGNTSAGSAKVRFESEKDGYGTGAMSQCINIGENIKFDFGVSVKKDLDSTQSGGARIRVSWNNKENCSGRSKTDLNWRDYTETNDWQILEIKNLTPPTYTRSVVIEVIQSIAGPGNFTLLWDDIYFKAVE